VPGRGESLSKQKKQKGGEKILRRMEGGAQKKRCQTENRGKPFDGITLYNQRKDAGKKMVVRVIKPPSLSKKTEEARQWLREAKKQASGAD